MNTDELRKHAEEGDAEAQYLLGKYLMTTSEDNYEEAIKWIKYAYNKKHIGATYELGQAYSLGKGIEESETKAIRFYKIAAEQGHAQSNYELAVSYFMGIGVKSDEDIALKYYKETVKCVKANKDYATDKELVELLSTVTEEIKGYYPSNAEQILKSLETEVVLNNTSKLLASGAKKTFGFFKKVGSKAVEVGDKVVEEYDKMEEKFSKEYEEASKLNDHSLYYAWVEAINPMKKIVYQRVAIDRGLVEKNDKGIYEWKR